MLSGSRQSASCFSTSPDVPNLWKVHWNITVNILRQEYRPWWCELADVFRYARTSWTTSGWPACLLVRNGNLDPLYTGIYASSIIRRLIKPTRGPHGIPYRCPLLTPLGPPGPPIEPLRPLNSSPGLIELLKSPQLPYKSLEDPSNVIADPVEHLTLPSWPPGTQ